MSDRLHEIIGQIGALHKELLQSSKIENAKEVLEYIKSYDLDVQEHYKNLLIQYYFQNNDVENLKELLLANARFEIRFSDIKDAFCNINSSKLNVIEFLEDSILYLKDDIDDAVLAGIFEYYDKNKEYQVYLEEALEIIKRNRYICAYAFKNNKEFFINEDLLESLKRDLPHLLK